VIAETVATPIEEQINGVEGMLYMSSQATTDGLMTLTVTFKLGTDPDKAQQLVQNRVSQAEPRLPEEVRTLGITTIKSSPDLTMVVHLLSPNGRYDMTYLRNYAVLNVKDRLARVEGVGDVQLFGSGDYSMRVWLDPQKVAKRGLSPSDVVAAIRGQNVQAAAGIIGASPNLHGIDVQLSVNAQGRLQTEDEFGDIIVKTGADGAVTRLRDVARIELGAADYSLRSLLDNKEAVAIPIFQAPGSNAIAISNGVRADDGRAAEEHARRRDYEIVYDPTQFVRASIESVVHTLLEAIALVVLVVILFLQTWRASIIPLLAVPVSVIGTFAVMQPVRLLDQRAEPVRAGAGDRHRRRRRDRGGRERRAQHRGGPVAARRDLPRDARGLRARSSRSRWCWSPCSCRWRSSAASPASSTSSSR
jgi:multidrug efflux pump